MEQVGEAVPEPQGVGGESLNKSEQRITSVYVDDPKPLTHLDVLVL